MSERKERQWILAIQRGDKKYLQDIAGKYYDDIFRFCAFQTGSIQDAYDLAQETFLRFIRYVESYHSRNLKGYLLTIAMNVCRNYHRSNYRNRGNVSWGEETAAEGEIPGKEQNLEEKAVEREGTAMLMEALRSLPDIQREAILLHYFYDMKYWEIARQAGVGTATVKSRARQGMEKLRGLLKKEDFYWP